MSQHTLPQALKGLYDRHKFNQARPSLGEIRATLHSVGSLYSKIFIIIDALDECRTVGDGVDMFIREIFDFQADVNANLFATSRPIQNIESKFQKATRLEIRANAEDVKWYIEKRLQDCQFLGSQSTALREQIKLTITKAVDGMFLLARLYIDSLACKTTAKEIKRVLQELDTVSQTKNGDTRSKALDKAYEQAMERIQSQVQEHRTLAMQVLLWISCAERRLTSAELQHAIGVEQNTSELDQDNIPDIGLIVSTSAGLVIVDRQSDIIRLVHHTTQEYFQRTWERWFPNAHIEMTKVQLLDFDDTLPIRRDESIKTTGLHLAAHFGLSETASLLLSKNASIEYERLQRAPLSFLNDTGYKPKVELLLRNNVDIESVDSLERTPLALAAQNGHEAVVKLFLEKKANIECMGPFQRTPLSLATEHGHEAVVNLLLEKGAKIESRDKYGWAPLFIAAQNGHEPVVKLLLANGADFVSKKQGGDTPLFLAALNGHEAVVKLLLANDADVESANNSGNTPLSVAAWNGHIAVVKLLLKENANIESKDKYGTTPFLNAAQRGHEVVMKLLLERNANFTTTTINGETPLSAAAWQGREAVVKLLLEKHVNIESTNSNGETPLFNAAETGHALVVKLLLENGANMEAMNRDGKTPLSIAVINGHGQVAKLMLQYQSIV
ncbi:hypothetical protein PITC_064160 [Penicillium italicum]|uniref:Uncharacterized protein n=1 Tax=Penicillium italicum TaxID=40296 RepID=A0A0A2KL56_PENIT|nr:hypothetical protein PITC_064160 [Penicillium italicum]